MGWGRGFMAVTDLPFLISLRWAYSLNVVPIALCPLPEVCGGDDQIQRGAGGLP